MGENMYTISEVSKKLNLSIYTIRYYTNKGLVPNLKHGANGERLFDDDALNWLKAIQFFRENGASLKEVNDYFAVCLNPEGTLDQRYAFIAKMKRNAEQRLAEIQYQNQVLAQRMAHLQAIKEHRAKDDSNPLTWRPDKFC